MTSQSKNSDAMLHDMQIATDIPPDNNRPVVAENATTQGKRNRHAERYVLRSEHNELRTAFEGLWSDSLRDAKLIGQQSATIEIQQKDIARESKRADRLARDLRWYKIAAVTNAGTALLLLIRLVWL